NNHLAYQNGKKPENIAGFNPDYINLKDFTLKADNISLDKNEKLQANLNAFSFQEASGLTLKQLGFALKLDQQHLNINDLEFKFDHSSLAANISAQYSSMDAFINHPKNSLFTVDLSHLLLDLNDIFQLQPDLKSNEYFQKLSRKKISGKVEAEGSLTQMNLSEFLVQWGDHTRIQTHGQFKNLATPDSVWMDIDQFSFETLREDIVSLIPEDSLGISIPDFITLNSQARGRLNNLKTQTQLLTSDGRVQLRGHYKNQDNIAFDAHLNIDDLKLGKILQNPAMGPITFSLNASGEGNSLSDLTGKLSSDFSKLQVNDYDFSALQLTGNMDHGTGHINLAYEDPNLDLDILSTVEIDSASKTMGVDFNLHGADLKTLGLTNRELKARMLMTASTDLQNGNIVLKSQVSEGTVVYNEETYPLGKVNFAALLLKDSTSVDVDSNFLNMKLRSNADLNRISSAIARQLNRYFSDSIQPPDSIRQPVRLKLNMDFHPNDLLTENFVPSIQNMDTLRLGVEFYQKENLLMATMSLPYLNYGGNIIDSLGIKVNSTEDSAQFAFGFKHLDAAGFVMNPTYFNGNFSEDGLTLKFNSLDDNYQPFYVIQTQISGKNDSLNINIVPDNL